VGDGFLFDGVDVAGDDFAVDEELQFTRDVSSDPAETNLAVANVAVACAGRAADSFVG
jgi:hypothetical protein